MPRAIVRSVLPSLLFAALATTAVGQTSIGDCERLPTPDPNSMRVGRVTGDQRIPFREGVPSECKPNEHGCFDPYYPLKPGEAVAVFQSYEGYYCVEGIGTGHFGHGRFGWIPRSRIEVEPDRPPPASWWIGSWTDNGGPSLTITRRHGKLYVEGGDEQVGDRFPTVEGIATVSGAGLIVWQDGENEPTSPDSCLTRLVRLGDRIDVRTSEGCGLTMFSGIFHRQ